MIPRLEEVLDGKGIPFTKRIEGEKPLWRNRYDGVLALDRDDVNITLVERAETTRIFLGPTERSNKDVIEMLKGLIDGLVE